MTKRSGWTTRCMALTVSVGAVAFMGLCAAPAVAQRGGGMHGGAMHGGSGFGGHGFSGHGFGGHGFAGRGFGGSRVFVDFGFGFGYPWYDWGYPYYYPYCYPYYPSYPPVAYPPYPETPYYLPPPVPTAEPQGPPPPDGRAAPPPPAKAGGPDDVGLYYLNRRRPTVAEGEPGLRNAVDDIQAAFRTSNVTLLEKHLDMSQKLTLMTEGHTRQPLDTAMYVEMTRDAMANMNTVSYDLNHVEPGSNGTWMVYGTHVLRGDSGKEKAFNVSFVLRKNGERFVITEVSADAAVTK